MQSLESQRRYWDRQAASAEFTLSVDAALLSQRLPGSARLLDLGCGYGRTLKQLAAAGFSNLLGLAPPESPVRYLSLNGEDRR